MTGGNPERLSRNVNFCNSATSFSKFALRAVVKVLYIHSTTTYYKQLKQLHTYIYNIQYV